MNSAVKVSSALSVGVGAAQCRVVLRGVELGQSQPLLETGALRGQYLLTDEAWHAVPICLDSDVMMESGGTGWDRSRIGAPEQVLRRRPVRGAK